MPVALVATSERLGRAWLRCWCVHSSADEVCCCLWVRYVFEHTLVLPEYLVEYEYDATPACRLQSGAALESLDSQGQAALDGLDYDIRLIARPLVPLLLAANAAELDEHGNPVVQLTGKESGMEVVNSGPKLDQRPKVLPLRRHSCDPGRSSAWNDVVCRND